MKIQIVKTLSFNEARERKRLEECFKGATLKRQLAILDALKEFQRFGHACVVEAKVKPENEG